jgi:hypothetical protein
MLQPILKGTMPRSPWLGAALLLLATAAPDPALPSPAGAGDPGFLHPLCLRDLLQAARDGGAPEPLPLQACNAGYRDVPSTLGARGIVSAQGHEAGTATWLGYRRIGKLPGGDGLVLVYENTGGSGVFSSLERLRQVGEGAAATLVLVRFYGGGDRCNGGLRDARLEPRGQILTDAAITPADLMAAGGAGEAFQPYRDLDASAAGCIVFATLERAADEDGEPRLVSVTIEALPDLTAWDQPPARQACFNEEVRAAVGDLPATLDAARVRALTGAIASACRR